MVEEMLAIQNKGNKDNVMDDMSAHQDQFRRKDFGLDWTDYRYWTVEEMLDKS